MLLKSRIEARIAEAYDRFKSDEGDITGWSLKQELGKESGADDALTDYFIQILYQRAFEKNEAINIFFYLANFIVFPYAEGVPTITTGVGSEGRAAIYPGLVVRGNLRIMVLESLGLTDTLEAYLTYLLCKGDNEINEKAHLSQNQIDAFSDRGKAMEEITGILRNEWTKKLKGKPKIIHLNNQRSTPTAGVEPARPEGPGSLRTK